MKLPPPASPLPTLALHPSGVRGRRAQKEGGALVDPFLPPEPLVLHCGCPSLPHPLFLLPLIFPSSFSFYSLGTAPLKRPVPSVGVESLYCILQSLLPPPSPCVCFPLDILLSSTAFLRPQTSSSPRTTDQHVTGYPPFPPRPRLCPTPSPSAPTSSATTRCRSRGTGQAHAAALLIVGSPPALNGYNRW